MTELEAGRTVRLTNIQRFSLHDGPGIRTTVFLKGCPLHCPWCANPENIRYGCEPWRKSDGTSGVFGYELTLTELKEDLLKDKAFYLGEGGVTFSGGEPLLQIGQYAPLLEELKREHIHLALETALFVEKEKVETAAQYFDWWYVDMKVLEPGGCRKLLGGDVRQYLDNLSWLARQKVPLTVRIPCAAGMTDTAENLAAILSCIRVLGIEQTEIFAVHDLAREKYRSLNRAWTVDVSESGRAVELLAQQLEKNGISYRIIRL